MPIGKTKLITVRGFKCNSEIKAFTILIENPRYLKRNRMPRFTTMAKIKSNFLGSFSAIKIPIL